MISRNEVRYESEERMCIVNRYNYNCVVELRDREFPETESSSVLL